MVQAMYLHFLGMGIFFSEVKGNVAHKINEKTPDITQKMLFGQI